MDENQKTENTIGDTGSIDIQDLSTDSGLNNQENSLTPESKKGGSFSFLKNVFKKSKGKEPDNISDNLQSDNVKTKNNDYISISDNKNAEDIFSELGDLDFGQIDQEGLKEKQEINPLVKIIKITTTCLWLLLIIVVVLFFDSYIKTTESNTVISFLPPLCDYISYPIDSYNNTDCKTIPSILASLNESKKNLEGTVLEELKKLISKKIQIDNINKSAEVNFIKEKNSKKVSFIDIINRFEEIKNNVKVNGRESYKGEDIECGGYSFNEKGELYVNCIVYGGALIDFVSKKSNSARITALQFLEDLQAQDSGFTIVDPPQSLYIEKFSSSEAGIKGGFFTSTSLSLILKFISSNNKI